MPLDATYLDYIRDAMADSFPTVTATLLRNDPRQDAAGTLTDNWVAITTYDGRLLADKEGTEDTVFGRVTPRTTAVWSMRPYADGTEDALKILPQDRLRINGNDWDVTGNDAERTSGFRLMVDVILVTD
jgi:hypothetical protein